VRKWKMENSCRVKVDREGSMGVKEHAEGQVLIYSLPA
jgi:hypothetical protein